MSAVCVANRLYETANRNPIATTTAKPTQTMFIRVTHCAGHIS